MSPSWQQIVTGPAIHALIIGAGTYPHAGPNAQDPFLRRLRTLTSPARSAVALSMALTSIPDILRRVASVDLLVSDSSLAPDGWSVLAPTRANIDIAFAAWKKRSTRAEDTLLFYFCGHGFQTSQLFVMPEDIGANEENPLTNAINVTLTRLALSRAPQRTQLWLIDACREAPREVVEQLGEPGSSLAKVIPGGHANLDSMFLSATIDFQLAKGIPGGLSLFASGLLDALKGGAAEPEGNRWTVRTGRLQRAINESLRHAAEKYKSVPQHCECLGGTGAHELFTFTSPPQVALRVRCAPFEHHSRVELFLRGGGNEIRQPPQAGPWDTAVAAGLWDLSAKPTDPNVAPVGKTCFVMPPVREEELQWPE